MNQHSRRMLPFRTRRKSAPDSTQMTRRPSSEASADAASDDAAHEWNLEVERGPNWLFVKVSDEGVGIAEHRPLADQVMSLLEEYFTTRFVLELEQVDMPPRQLIPQLERLDRWVDDHDGVMRLCGLSADCRLAIRRRGLGDHLRACRNRQEAVFGSHWPGQPR